jgi:hypothetical protein
VSDTADTLRREAELADAEPEEEYAYAKPSKARRPAQVYSVRIPPDRLEELRKVAARQGVTVGSLIRAWVLERLDKEKDLSPEMTLLKAAIVAAVVEALEAGIDSRALIDPPQSSVSSGEPIQILDLWEALKATVEATRARRAHSQESGEERAS